MPYNNKNRAKIIIVDSHPIIREGMAAIINKEPGLHACCQAENARQALEHSASCRHHLAIIDTDLLDASGLRLAAQCVSKYPQLRVLMMSSRDETIYAERALCAGAHGFIMKQAATAAILQAIYKILGGELYVSEQIHARILKSLIGGAAKPTSLQSLTNVEFEILHLLGMAQSVSEVAAKLQRSTKTINSHRANIKRKLNITNSNDLTRYAINWVRDKETLKS